MKNYQNIKDKLRAFSVKYYVKKLVKGLLLFVAFGALFFMGILGVEYLFWLNSDGRLLLLALIVIIELGLLYFYILVPMFYLFKLKKGISDKEASLVIGRHFPEVGDKLFNLLDLQEDSRKSELLMASIDQRSEDLGSIPFTQAISFKDSFRFAQYLIIPVILFVLIWLSGQFNTFFGSYNRVWNYELAYEPPAPFQFKLLSEDLSTLENETFVLQAYTVGEIKPEDVFIEFEGKRLLLNNEDEYYEYVFVPPFKSLKFVLSSNGIKSKEYTLKVLPVPSIETFEVQLHYPVYTGKINETLKGTGNAIVPEGTDVKWFLSGRNTDKMTMITTEGDLEFTAEGKTYFMDKKVLNDLDYSIAVSNNYAPQYEKLKYGIKVIKDESPTLEVKEVKDSLDYMNTFYDIKASDDYLIQSIRLKYYLQEDPKDIRELVLEDKKANFLSLDYFFPQGLEIDEGRDYSFYFEARDNDEVNGGKITRSEVFTTSILTEEQRNKRELESRENLINELDKNFENSKIQEKALKDINNKERETKELDYNAKQDIKELLRDELQKEKQTEELSRDLRENLEKSKSDELNQLLKERLEREEREARKNQELLKELEKVADKINKEELSKRLEELGKKQQNSNRNLKQILELTKRYYVTEKAAQLSRELERLAKEQNELAELRSDSTEVNKQKEINDKFNTLEDELKELNKDNQNLDKPIDLKTDSKLSSEIREDQKNALDDLKKQEEIDRRPQSPEDGGSENRKQKSAADKLQEMSEQLSASSSGGGEEGIVEDAEMLRQILDNLIIFSLEQEDLYDLIKLRDVDITSYSSSVKKQNELKKLFEHVDDSLFGLSLRRVELSEFVNEQITEAYYNMDKSLESIADNKVYQAAAYQQYTINASNSLADFLAGVLENMQMSMKSGSGKGDANEGFQLPDIISGQAQLNKKMGDMGKKGSQKGKGEDGEKGSEGAKAGKEGSSGSEGKDGKGKDGRNGSSAGNGSSGETGISEDEYRELYEIYKEQELIKQQLEKQLEDMMMKEDQMLTKKLLKQMEEFQKEILEQGYTERSRNRANYIEHELMKLEGATLKQGRKEEREATSARTPASNSVKGDYNKEEQRKREIEFLMRQALPLQQFYQIRVRDYFRTDDRVL
ncbi:hypothetical protein [Eudoraea sp.]|uniref:hypothetical protein n=1 Tax=Eudoraea sp. TaxID=1979955 RepID=UPI003C75436A